MLVNDSIFLVHRLTEEPRDEGDLPPVDVTADRAAQLDGHRRRVRRPRTAARRRPGRAPRRRDRGRRRGVRGGRPRRGADRWPPTSKRRWRPRSRRASTSRSVSPMLTATAPAEPPAGTDARADRRRSVAPGRRVVRGVLPRGDGAARRVQRGAVPGQGLGRGAVPRAGAPPHVPVVHLGAAAARRR